MTKGIRGGRKRKGKGVDTELVGVSDKLEKLLDILSKRQDNADKRMEYLHKMTLANYEMIKEILLLMANR